MGEVVVAVLDAVGGRLKTLRFDLTMKKAMNIDNFATCWSDSGANQGQDVTNSNLQGLEIEVVRRPT
eukprot:5885112-Alexandrium_andersonii.AAC.1